MTCTPELPGILCGPPGHRPTPGDLEVIARVQRYLRDLHAAEQENTDDQPRPKDQP